MRRRSVLAAIGALASGAVWPAGATLYRGAALAFGTTISVTLIHTDRRQAELAIGAALRAAQRIDRLMSIYDPASQVYQLNRDGQLAAPAPELLQVLALARRLSVLSGGAFDVTVQPLWTVFSAAAARAALPAPFQRDQARARVGWRHLTFDRQQVCLRQPGMAITLNGVAQGYAADVALAAVRAHGIRHALLDTGEFIARGDRQGAPWTLGIGDPRHTDQLATTLRLDGRALSTSGDYEMAFTPDFLHHHIFDPALGDSPTELASVSVTAPSGLLADGLSTAFMVMGLQRARTLAARLPGVGLLAIDKQGRAWRSAGFPAPA